MTDLVWSELVLTGPKTAVWTGPFFQREGKTRTKSPVLIGPVWFGLAVLGSPQNWTFKHYSVLSHSL